MICTICNTYANSEWWYTLHELFRILNMAYHTYAWLELFYYISSFRIGISTTARPQKDKAQRSSECKIKSESKSRNYRSRSLFRFSHEKRPRRIVSWFRFGFRFALQCPFRVPSSRELAVLENDLEFWIRHTSHMRESGAVWCSVCVRCGAVWCSAEQCCCSVLQRAAAHIPTLNEACHTREWVWCSVVQCVCEVRCSVA